MNKRSYTNGIDCASLRGDYLGFHHINYTETTSDRY